MIRINLLTVERKAARKKFAFTTAHKLTAGCTLVLIAAAGIIGWRFWAIDRDSKQLDAELVTAQREATRLHSIIVQVQEFDERKKELQQRVELIEQLRHEQTGPVHILDQISRALPQMLWLTTVKQGADANEVLISGKCISITAVTDFVSNLEASGYFKKSVEILNSETEPMPQPPGEIVSFSLRGRFQRAGDPVLPEAPPTPAPAPAAAAPPAKQTSQSSLKAGADSPDTAGEMELSLSKLPWYGQVGAFVLLAGGGLFAFYTYYEKPVRAEMSSREKQLSIIRGDIVKGQTTARKLDDFRGQVNDLESQLGNLRAVLPDEKDAADLLRSMQTVAAQSNLTIKSFKPSQPTVKEIHAEWPIQLELEGSYHNLAIFFDRVAKFTRIVNISALQVEGNTSKDKSRGNNTITAKCVATTFVLLDAVADDKAAGKVKTEKKKPATGAAPKKAV